MARPKVGLPLLAPPHALTLGPTHWDPAHAASIQGRQALGKENKCTVRCNALATPYGGAQRKRFGGALAVATRAALGPVYAGCPILQRGCASSGPGGQGRAPPRSTEVGRGGRRSKPAQPQDTLEVSAATSESSSQAPPHRPSAPKGLAACARLTRGANSALHAAHDSALLRCNALCLLHRWRCPCCRAVAGFGRSIAALQRA